MVRKNWSTPVPLDTETTTAIKQGGHSNPGIIVKMPSPEPQNILRAPFFGGKVVEKPQILEIKKICMLNFVYSNHSSFLPGFGGL